MSPKLETIGIIIMTGKLKKKNSFIRGKMCVYKISQRVKIDNYKLMQ